MKMTETHKWKFLANLMILTISKEWIYDHESTLNELGLWEWAQKELSERG